MTGRRVFSHGPAEPKKEPEDPKAPKAAGKGGRSVAGSSGSSAQPGAGRRAGRGRSAAAGQGPAATGRSVTGRSVTGSSAKPPVPPAPVPSRRDAKGTGEASSRTSGRVVVSSNTPAGEREALAPHAARRVEGEEVIDSPIPTSKDDIRSVLRGEDREADAAAPDFLAPEAEGASPSVQQMITDPAYGGTPGIVVRPKRLRNTERIDQERRAQTRHRVFVTLRFILAAALVVAIFWALLCSPLLRYDASLTQVEGANQWVDGQAIERIVEDQNGRSLLVVGTEQKRRDLSALTGVSEVSVTRSFPHALTVQMTCATPAAVLHVTGDGTLVPVTADGEALMPQADESAYAGIPRIDVDTADAASNNEAVSQAVKVMAGFTPQITARVTSTSARTRDSITSTLDDGAITVQWGDAQDIDLKVLIVEKILSHKDAGDPDYEGITTITVSSPRAPIVK